MFKGLLVNNTGADIRDFEQVIREEIDKTGSLPMELADLFTLELVPVTGLDPRDNGCEYRAFLKR